MIIILDISCIYFETSHRTSGKFVEMDITLNINECAGNLIMKVYYTRVGERRRMFGEISRTGKDRLNVKGGGGNERIGIWAELVVEYYRLNGNQESR